MSTNSPHCEQCNDTGISDWFEHNVPIYCSCSKGVEAESARRGSDSSFRHDDYADSRGGYSDYSDY